MKINKIDLNKAWIRAVKDFLIKKDFKKIEGLSDDLIAIRSNNYFRKGGMDFKWNVNIPEDFFQNLSISDNEYRSINNILDNLNKGKGAYDYLSSNAKNFNNKNIDFLFNRLGITHFHLDKLNEKSKKKRSKNLLFIYFDYKEKMAKIIGVYNHKKWFNNQVLIDFVNLYPEVLNVENSEKKVIKIGSPDLFKSKKNFYFVEVFYDDDSNSYIIGNAVVSTGDAEWDTRVVNQYFYYLNNLSNKLNESLEKCICNNDEYREKLKDKELNFHLVIKENLKMDLIDKVNDAGVCLDIDTIVLRFFLCNDI